MFRYRYLSAKITPLEQERNPTIRTFYQAALKREEERNRRIHERTVKYLLKMRRSQKPGEKINLAPCEDDNLVIRRAKETIIEVLNLLNTDKQNGKLMVKPTLPNGKKRKSSAPISQEAKRSKLYTSLSMKLKAQDDADVDPAAALLSNVNTAAAYSGKMHVKTDLEPGNLSSGTPVSPELLQGTVAEDHLKINEEQVFNLPLKSQMDVEISKSCSSHPIQSQTFPSELPVKSKPETTHQTYSMSFSDTPRQAEFIPYSSSLKGPTKQKKQKTKNKPRKKKSSKKKSSTKQHLNKHNYSEATPSLGMPKNSPKSTQCLPSPIKRKKLPDNYHIPHLSKPKNGGHGPSTINSLHSDAAHHKIQPIAHGQAPKSKLWQQLLTQRSYPPNPKLLKQAKKNAAMVSNHQRQRPFHSVDDDT